MENTNALTIKTQNANNEYNLILTDFTHYPTYIREEIQDYDSPNNQILFTTTPTIPEIKACLQTNINHIQNLIPNAGDDAYYDYIPDYITELLYFIGGLYNQNAISRTELVPYLTLILNIELDEFQLNPNNLPIGDTLFLQLLNNYTF